MEQDAEKEKTRRANSLKNQEEDLREAETRQQGLDKSVALWKKILAELTAPRSERHEEGDAGSWVDFFQKLNGQEIPRESLPPSFQQNNSLTLSFQDVVIRLSTFICSQEKQAERASRSKQRLDKALQKSVSWQGRVEEARKRKLEEAFGKGSEEWRQANNRKLYLDCLQHKLRL